MSAEATQILVAVIGLVGTLAPLAKNLLSRKRKDEDRVSVTGERRRTAAPLALPPRSLSDLALYLLCSAGFCILLADSIVISGRSPTLSDAATFAIPFSAALTMTTVIYFAWRKGRAEATVGVLALSTAVVLLLAPGGAFLEPRAGGEKGLPLLVPLLVLSTLIATAVFYQTGVLIARKDARRFWAYGVLGIIAICGAISIGRQAIQMVAEDPRNPVTGLDRPALGNVKGVLDSVRDLSLPNRTRFYQFASEATMGDTYADAYFQLQPSLDAVADGRASLAKASAAPATTAESQPAPQPTTAARQATARTPVQSATRDQSGASSYAVLDPTVALDSQQTRDKDNRRFDRLQALVLRYRRLGSTAAAYLADRGQWIHPAGKSPERNEADYPLPGVSVADRAQALSNQRMIHALDPQANSLWDLVTVFDYPRPVLENFLEPDYSRSPGNTGPIFKPSLKKNKEPLSDEPFAPLESRTYTTALLEQLGLPTPEENYLAYSEYFALLQETQKDKQVNEALSAYWNLPAVARQAILKYVSPENEWRSTFPLLDKVASFCKAGHDCNKSLERLTRDPNALGELADALRKIPDQPAAGTQPAFDLVDEALDHNGEEIEAFARVLSLASPSASMGELFADTTFDLVRTVHKLNDTKRATFFKQITDPCSFVAGLLVSTLAKSDENAVRTVLDKFLALDKATREAVLHSQALTIFRPTGPYAIDPIGNLFVRAGMISPVLAIGCAALLTLPLTLMALLLGAYLARVIVSHDLLRRLIETERRHGEVRSDEFVHPVAELVGRGDVVSRLKRLANRGASTIAVVGRRGIGKTRILHDLYESAASGVDNNRGSLGVWIATPARFDEEEFIASVFERLAAATEEAVATRLRAEPYAVRKLENGLARTLNIAVASALVLITTLVFSIANMTDRSEVLLGLLPAGVIIIVAMVAWALSFARSQPVDLGPWLSRDRSQSPHTVLLYRSARDAMSFLDRRRALSGTGSDAAAGKTMTHPFWTFGGLLFVVTGLVGFVSERNQGPWGFLIFVGFASGLVASLTRLRPAPPSPRGIMSLIAEYREFATTVVHRLQQDALGEGGTDCSIVVCIDELDKITKTSDIRAFLQRIKAIFEVPGVYYYLSMAEDVMRAMYLGSSTGKNEVDSSLDHVVRVDPLDLRAGTEMAKRYLLARNLGPLSDRIPVVLSLLSFGVARDLLRRCDELLADREGEPVSDDRLLAYVGRVRRQRAQLGYEAGLLSKAALESFSHTAEEAADASRAMLEAVREGTPSDMIPGRETRKVALEVWLLALVEFVLSTGDPKDVENWANEISTIGFLIPVREPEELIQLVSTLSRKLGFVRAA